MIFYRYRTYLITYFFNGHKDVQVSRIRIHYSGLRIRGPGSVIFIDESGTLVKSENF